MKSWWYLSFCDDDGWQGAAFVKAASLNEAIKESWRLNCNPGGEVLLIDVGDDIPSEAYLNRLLTKEELEMAVGPVSSLTSKNGKVTIDD